MKSTELLQDVFKKARVKNVAEEMNLSSAMVYKWAQPAGGLNNPLDRVAQLIRFTGDQRLAQWVCEQAGGYFVPNPRVKGGKPVELMSAENEAVQEFGCLISDVSSSAKDGCITSKEAAAIRERWDNLKSVMESFVACCEKGDFSVYHAHVGNTKTANFSNGTAHARV